RVAVRGRGRRLLGQERTAGTLCPESRQNTDRTRRGANRTTCGVCAPSLEPREMREGSTGKCPRFQPDWGNLAVRDDRGGRRKRAAARIEAPAKSRSGAGNS